MAIECAYSFTDLYRAAFGREPDAIAMAEFGRSSRQQRNTLVTRWAQLAGWETKDKVGSDGQVYTAFAPKF